MPIVVYLFTKNLSIFVENRRDSAVLFVFGELFGVVGHVFVKDLFVAFGLLVPYIVDVRNDHLKNIGLDWLIVYLPLIASHDTLSALGSISLMLVLQ